MEKVEGPVARFAKGFRRAVFRRGALVSTLTVLVVAGSAAYIIYRNRIGADSIGELAYVQSDGMFVMEGEHFYQNKANDGQLWTQYIDPTDSPTVTSIKSGSGKWGGGVAGHSPGLGYYLNIEDPGQYFVYVRAAGPNPGNGGATCFFGFNNIPSEGDGTLLFPGNVGPDGTMSWTKNDVTLTTKGAAMLNIWQRTADFRIDKIIVTKDPNYLAVGSTDLGPAESPTVPLSTLNRPPVAGATASVMLGDSPLSVNFSNNSTDPNGNETIASYAWDFGDGTTSVEASPNHVFTNSSDAFQKTFTVKLTVTDTGGATGFTTLTITANKVVAFGEYFTDSKGLINSAGIHVYPIPDVVKSGKLEYRVTGSTTWHDALPPVITVANGRLETGNCEFEECLDLVASNLEPMIRRFIGGVTGLSPSTTYDFRTTLLKENGSTYDTKTLQVTTMPDKLAYGTGRTINIKADGGGDYTSVQNAIDAALPGDTIELQPGDYTWGFTFNNKNGTPGNPITLRGLEGAVFHDTVGSEARINDNSHDIILEGLNVNSAPTDITKYSTLSLWANNARITLQNSTLHNTKIYSTRSATDLIIQNNEITWDRYVTYAMYLAGGPYRGLIYRNNYLRSTSDSYDIAVFRNRKEFAEIYNNYFEGMHGDDGIEVEGGAHINVFFHDNTLKFRQGSSAHGGKGNVGTISNTPILVGPIYFFHNNIDVSNEFIKTSNGSVTNALAVHTLADFGPIFYLNNTFYQNSSLWPLNDFFLRASGVYYHANFTFKNNIFYGKVYDRYGMDAVFGGTYPRSGIWWGQIASDYNLFYKPGVTTNPWSKYPVDEHSVFADPLFANGDNFDLHLNSGSPAIDKGTFISGITDTYSGSAPDMGAFEYGTTSGNHAPILDPIPAKTVETGKATTFTLSARDIDEGDTVTYSSSNLPTGATLDATTGAFVWTPTTSQTGVYNIDFKASDKSLALDVQTAKITVTAPNNPPVLNPIGDQTVEVAHILSFNVTASDSDGGAIQLSANNLPPGATFTPGSANGSSGSGASGLFYWIPNIGRQGTYDVSFHATDALGAHADEAITIIVTYLNQPPVINPTASVTSGVKPLTVNFLAHATDADGTIASYLWDFADGSTSVIANPTHIFTTKGDYNVALTVTDNENLSSTAHISISVVDSVIVDVFNLILGYTQDKILDVPQFARDGSGELSIPYKIRSAVSSNNGTTKTSQIIAFQSKVGDEAWQNVDLANVVDRSQETQLSSAFDQTALVTKILTKNLYPDAFIPNVLFRFKVQIGTDKSDYAEVIPTTIDNKMPEVVKAELSYNTNGKPLITADVTDDNPIEMIVSEKGDFSDAAWQAYASPVDFIQILRDRAASPLQQIIPPIITLKDIDHAYAAETVMKDIFVRFQDYYGNQTATYTVSYADDTVDTQGTGTGGGTTTTTTTENATTPANNTQTTGTTTGTKKTTTSTKSNVTATVDKTATVALIEIPNSAPTKDAIPPVFAPSSAQKPAAHWYSGYSIYDMVIYILAILVFIVSILNLAGYFITSLKPINTYLDQPIARFVRLSLFIAIAIIFAYVVIYRATNYYLISYVVVMVLIELLVILKNRTNAPTPPPPVAPPPEPIQMPAEPLT